MKGKIVGPIEFGGMNLTVDGELVGEKANTV